MSDDFGYLSSVIETILRGRPWTDEWLEPWAASLSGFSAILFWLTKSFSFAIHGLLVACAAVCAAAMIYLLWLRLKSGRLAVVVSLLILTTPTLLWTAVDFSSAALYIPCLLLALIATEKRSWLLFGLAFAIAVSSRQSAVAWLVFPVCELLRFDGRSKAWLRPALTFVLCAGLILLLSFALNKTHSQRLITDQLWLRFDPTRFSSHLGVGICVWIVAVGLGALALTFRSEALAVTVRLRRVFLCAVILAGLLICRDSLPTIFMANNIYEGHLVAAIYVNLMICAALAGLLVCRFRLRLEFVFASMAALLLVCLRSEIWDYYLIDVACFGFFGSVPRSGMIPTTTEEGKAWRSKMAYVAASLLVACHLFFGFRFKLRVDREYATCVVMESALRQGRLEILDIGRAPFGFVGWHLHRHFIANDGKEDPDIGGFLRYLRKSPAEPRLSRMRIWKYSKSLRPIDGPDGDRVIASQVFRVAWFWNQRVSVLCPPSSQSGSPDLRLDKSQFEPKQFPLDDREWLALASGRR